MKTLNAYQIFWGIVTLKERLTPNQAKSLSRLSGSTVKSGSDYFCFWNSEDKIDECMQNIVTQLAISGLSGEMHKITDKQYGLIANSWNGKAKEIAAPFTNKVELVNGKMISVVPLSDLQVKQAISF